MKIASMTAAAALAMLAGTASAQGPSPFPKAPEARVPADPSRIAGGKRIKIINQNLTVGQGFSPAAFLSHNMAATTRRHPC